MRQVAEALADARRGDQTAFADLVRHHQGMVFGLAYNFLRDRALAEELAQEVFLHLYRSLTQIESPEHLSFWLRKVTGHRCIDYTRRHKHDARVSVDDLPDQPCEFRQSDPLMSEMLKKLVATLPERPRMILALRYQEDLDPAEIAEVLSMPVNTVKSHLRRSLAMLREKVSRSLGEVEV
jgi:RNA polymerase sigma-70 factor (ECF subfamily)